MLRVPWIRVTSVGDKLLQVLRVLGILLGSILWDTARTRSISLNNMITLNTACTRSILGFNTLEYSLYLKYFGSCTAPSLSSPSTWAFHTAKNQDSEYFRV